MTGRSPSRRFAAVVALTAWFALALQYVLIIVSPGDGIGPLLATFRYVAFFTIISNVMVALTATFAVLPGSSSVAALFRSARLRGCTALCIGITLAIYHSILAATWDPQGAQWLADVTLHYAVPLLYLAWWFLFAPHGELGWFDAVRWLLFPAVYVTCVLLRGAWLHEYPYPFIDVDALGAAAVARNAVGVGLLFLVVGLALVALDRWRARSVRA
ncbi:MAG: Pr6Pr family membrane protein [Dokdonella sp.]|uniref:Pr6Pr family membrane protein n=1 Tax=Dokdonella sp. TaxID=2291710 RepID=UPI0032677124